MPIPCSVYEVAIGTEPLGLISACFLSKKHALLIKTEKRLVANNVAWAQVTMVIKLFFAAQPLCGRNTPCFCNSSNTAGAEFSGLWWR